jgi:hypothetical protein
MRSSVRPLRAARHRVVSCPYLILASLIVSTVSVVVGGRVVVVCRRGHGGAHLRSVA